MVKYGKEFRRIQIEEWKEKYFDYKKFKQIIKSYLSEIEINQQKNIIDTDIEKQDFLTKLITQFTEKMDKEIHRIYIFFTNKERQLYKSMNKLLYQKDETTNLDLEEYLNEFQKLNEISTLSYNLSQFVYYNLKAAIKILKKFDKKIIGIKDKENHIKKNYIKVRLEEQNSDILYLLNFKMIDEITVILEVLLTGLNDHYNKNKSNFSKKKNLLENNKEMNFTEVNNEINNITPQIKNHIKQIDITSFNIVKKLFHPWRKFLLMSGDVSSKLIQLTNSVSDASEAFKNTKSIVDTISFSRQNKINLLITLLHGFIYMYSFSVILPTYNDLLNLLNIENYWGGILMIANPLGAIFSYLYERKFFIYSTKIPLIVSCLLMIIGNLLYIFSCKFNFPAFLFISRFILGMGNLRTHNKMYIINKLLRKDVSLYLTMFHTASIIGIMLGFCINNGILYLENNDNLLFHKDVIGEWTSILFCIILFLVIIFFFTEANSDVFNKIEMLTFSKITNSSICEKDNNSIYNNNNNDITDVSNISIKMEKDEIMVKDINEKLGDYNRASNFNDTNLVTLRISELAYEEKDGLNYLFKTFFVYLIIVFTTKFICESLYINSYIFINEVPLWVIPTIFTIANFLTLVIEFCLRNKTFYISEKHLIMILFSANVLVNCLFFAFNKGGTCFVIGFGILIGNLLEKYATHFFYGAIPEDYTICGIQGNIVINIFSMIAKIGSGMIMFVFLLKNMDNYYEIIVYGFITFFSLGSFILFIIFYSDLRVKSISRILKKMGNDQLKTATEI